MCTVLQERVPRQERVERWRSSMREPGSRRKKASWNNSRPDEASNKMGRQSQTKPLQPQHAFPSQENNNEKRVQQRRKHKPHAAQSKRNNCQHSTQGTMESTSHPAHPAEVRMQPGAQGSAHVEQKHAGSSRSRHTPAFPCHAMSDSTPNQLETPSTEPEVEQRGGHRDDSDTDLSESERLPALPSVRVPPQMELTPDVPEAEERSTRRLRPRGHGRSGFHFPDFLPPPFNSWNLSQLAVFYNMEGRGASRPRPVGCLERYLERLLQLEWYQMQTVREESGPSAPSDVISSCHRSHVAASSRLSSPKCILQCQRGFPLTFLSSLAGHYTAPSSCSCTLNRVHHSTCNPSFCRSIHGHSCSSRMNPTLERRGPRSYSESRVHSSDRATVSHAQRFCSHVRANSHLKRMQASGNIRNPAPGANTKPPATIRASSVSARGRVVDHRTGGVRKRSDSEQSRGGEAERRQQGPERTRSGSERRRGGRERGRRADWREGEIKPDAVTAIKDNLPGTKHPAVSCPNRTRQVQFAT